MRPVNRPLAVALPILLLALDRLAKWYAFAALPPERGAVLVPGLKLEYFFNPGLLFSLSSSAVASVVSAIAFVVLAAIALRRKLVGQPLLARDLWAFCLIALGGASNIFDRLASGGVTDYIIFARSAWNIADIMILAGIALMIGRAPTGGKRSGG